MGNLNVGNDRPCSLMMVYRSRLFLMACLLSVNFVVQAKFPVQAEDNLPPIAPSPAAESPVAPAISPESEAAPVEAAAPAWQWWFTLTLIPIALIGGVWYGSQQGQQKSSGLPAIASADEIAGQNGVAVDGLEEVQDITEDSAPNLEEAPDQDSAKDSAKDLGQLTQPANPIAVSETTRISRVDIVATLIQELHSSNPNKRRKAIWELGQRGDSRAIQPLVDLLVDSDSQQRSLILAAVSEISVRTLKPMSRALMMTIQDDSPEVRKNSIRDASRLFELVTQISQLLQYATNDGDREVQETAEWALSQLNRIRPMPGTEGLPSLSHHGSASLNASSDSRLPLTEETDRPSA
ncbi:HEAT repeat domain-containing protein [Egbenema bharatensis]|uniref:HEAT repeat domain-containing protein n=1 Tax=Egbenema bharatensis TaxID=3463334 RepID=UPI003A84D06E